MATHPNAVTLSHTGSLSRDKPVHKHCKQQISRKTAKLVRFSDVPLSSLCMQNMGQGLGPADEGSLQTFDGASPTTALHKLHSQSCVPRGHLANGKLPALCVSLQPVIKQLGRFSNMSVIKYLFCSAYFILMKKSGDCSVGQVNASLPPTSQLLPSSSSTTFAATLKYPQPPDAISSVPRQKSQEETQDKGGHIVTMSPWQSLADLSPFPGTAGPRRGAGLTLSASRIRPS